MRNCLPGLAVFSFSLVLLSGCDELTLVDECAEELDDCSELVTCVDEDEGFSCVDDLPPVVTLTSPVGGELIMGNHEITWETTDEEAGSVTIELSTDSGATYDTVLADGAPDTDSFLWDSTQSADIDSARVRVTATDAAGNVAAAVESPADFRINNVPPTAPTVAASDPVASETDLMPEITGVAEANTTVALFTDSNCTVSTGVTGTAAEFAAPGLTVSVGADTTTTFYATTMDNDGLESSCSTSSVTYTTMDITAPAPPTLTATDPVTGSDALMPRILGTAEADSTVELFSDDTCTTSTGVTGNAADFATPGLTVTVTADSATTYWARATDAAGNVSDCSTTSVRYAHSSVPNSPPQFFPAFLPLTCHRGVDATLQARALDSDPLTYSEGSGSTCAAAAVTVTEEGQVVVACEDLTSDSCTVSVLASDSINPPAIATVSVTRLPRAFVDDSVAASGDGSSWSTAFKTIEEGVAAVAPGSIADPHGDVWVRAGTYRAGTDATPVVDISADPWLIGSFAGTETLLSERDIANNPTILDGDRDGLGPGSDDSPSVVVLTGFAGGRLDGFTIRNGNGGTRGGGVFMGGDVFFTTNSLITNCRFENNTVNDNSAAGAGGALFIGLPGVVVENSVFIDNSIVQTGVGNAWGGAIYAGPDEAFFVDVYEVDIHSSIFINNTVSRPGGIQDGGAVFFVGSVGDDSFGNIINSLFVNNAILDGGSIGRGGAVSSGIHDLIVINSTFANNSVGTTTNYGQGGAIDDEWNPTEAITAVINSVFYGNSADTSPHVHAGTTPGTIDNSCVEGGATGTGNTDITADPFDVDGERYYLNDTAGGGAVCVNIGDNAEADSDLYGYGRMGVDWREMTTQLDLTTETENDGAGSETVDAGIHY